MRFKIDPKKLEEAEGELLTDFSNFVEEKRHPNIVCVNKNSWNLWGSNIATKIDYYPHRINKIEMFWEKNTFDFLIEIVKQNHNMKQKIEIVNLFLSIGFWEHKGDSNPYNVMHSILLAYNIIKV